MTIVIDTPRGRHGRVSRPKSHTPQIGPYQSIYRYISLATEQSWKYLEETIQSNKLIGQTNAKLNDPFELNPCIIDDITPESIRDSHSYFSSAGGEVVAQPLVGGGMEDVGAYSRHAKAILARTIENSRIISFSDRMDSPLLWAHYARSHAGACLHFVGKAFAGLDCRKGVVTYSSQRPTLPLSLALKLKAHQKHKAHPVELMKLETELDRALFFTKPQDWAYEGEYRVIYSTTKQTNIEFDPAGLVEVLVGLKAPPETDERIRALVSRRDGSMIAVRRASISSRTFAVDVAAR